MKPTNFFFAKFLCLKSNQSWKYSYATLCKELSLNFVTETNKKKNQPIEICFII